MDLFKSVSFIHEYWLHISDITFLTSTLKKEVISRICFQYSYTNKTDLTKSMGRLFRKLLALIVLVDFQYKGQKFS